MEGLPRIDRLLVAVTAPLLAFLLVALVALVAGCGGNGSGTQPGASPSRGSGPPAGSSGTHADTHPPGPSRPASAPPTGSGASSSGGCASSELSVALANSDHALSHTYVQLVFTNTSRRSCMIGGYPGVSQVDAAGGQLGAAADRTGPAGGALTLAPGQQARATLTIISPGVQPGCLQPHQTATAVGLRIYPPANRAAMFLRYPDPQPACTSPDVHQLTVTALLR